MDDESTEKAAGVVDAMSNKYTVEQRAVYKANSEKYGSMGHWPAPIMADWVHKYGKPRRVNPIESKPEAPKTIDFKCPNCGACIVIVKVIS